MVCRRLVRAFDVFDLGTAMVKTSLEIILGKNYSKSPTF
jgi:hypothetical protein